MTHVDTLSTRFVLEDDYTAKANKATAATNAFATASTKAAAANKALAASAGSFGKPGTAKSNPFGSGKTGVSTKSVAGTNPFENFSTGVDKLRDSAREAVAAFAPLQSLVLGIVGVGVAAGAGAFALGKQAAEFDGLRQSLIAVEGDAKKAGDALKRLKDLAKAPGLGFEEAVRGYTGLRNAGQSQQFAEQLVKEFANANARGGGNAETFGRIMTQVRQASTRPFLQQEDLTPIAEAGVPINKILKDAFGTGDAEELKKKGIGAQQALEGIVKELTKLQRVAGGAQNEFDNAGDALKFASIAAGEGINQSLLPMLGQFSTALGELSESGEITAAFSTAANNIAEGLNVSTNDMKSAAKDFLLGVRDFSTYARNLLLNAQGAADTAGSAYTWLSDTLGWVAGTNVAPWDSNYAKWRKDESGQDLSAMGEVQRNALDAGADEYNGERGKWLAARKDGSFSGSFKEWQAKGGSAALSKSAASDSSGEKKDGAVVEQLKKLVEINRHQLQAMLEDIQSGGGGLVKNQTGAMQLASVGSGLRTGPRLRRAQI